MSLYYYFSLGDVAPAERWSQRYTAAVAASYFQEGVPDLVDLARILELQAQRPDLSVRDDFSVLTGPVPDGAVIQRGDPSVVTPDEAREEQALEQMIAWANEYTPWALWLFDLIWAEADGYTVPGDSASLCWRDGEVVVRPSSCLPDEYEFSVPDTAGATVEVDGQTYKLDEDIWYTLEPSAAASGSQYLDLRAQVQGEPNGTEIYWTVWSKDLRAWGEARDWGKGLVGIFDPDDD